MKNKWIILILFLLLSLPSYSQKSSKISSTDCIVPCESLRNALVRNEQKILLEQKMVVVLDSLRLYQEIVSKQNQIIINNEKVIEVLDQTKRTQENIITEKDNIISEYKDEVKKQKTYKVIGYTTNILTLLTFLYFIR